MVKSEVVLILPPIVLVRYKGDTGETRLPGPLGAALRRGVPLRKATAVARAPTQGAAVGRIWASQKPARGRPRNPRECLACAPYATSPIRPIRPIRPMEPLLLPLRLRPVRPPFCILTPRRGASFAPVPLLAGFCILPRGAAPEPRRGDTSPRAPRCSLAVCGVASRHSHSARRLPPLARLHWSRAGAAALRLARVEAASSPPSHAQCGKVPSLPSLARLHRQLPGFFP